MWVPSTSSGTSLPASLSSVLRQALCLLDGESRVLWKSFRNHPGQGSDKWPKVTDLKSESVTGFIPES